jgi:enoyl-[acyl-carrier protein] reductase II
MLRTRLCDVIGIDVPIVLAPFGPWDEVDLAVAVSNAGALGSVGTAVRSVDELRSQWNELRRRTDRPFTINHTGRPLNEEAFAASLDAGPAAISFHMGVPRELIARAHDRGVLWLQTVGDAEAAEVALAAGADVLIAQGTEAGGNAGWITTLVLVPTIVDLAGDVPVVAAGGIADALALGAQGASLGTRFLATTEMHIEQTWKDRIVAANALDAVKVPHSDRVLPPFNVPQIGRPFAPRSLRTPLVTQLETEPDSVDPAVVGPRLVDAVLAGRGSDFLPFAGQSSALVDDVVPAAQLVTRLITEAEAALERAASLVRSSATRVR